MQTFDEDMLNELLIAIEKAARPLAWDIDLCAKYTSIKTMNNEKLAMRNENIVGHICFFGNYRLLLVLKNDGVEYSLFIANCNRLWRSWSMRFKWFKRAADYDVYIDKLKQADAAVVRFANLNHRGARGSLHQFVFPQTHTYFIFIYI